SRVSFNAPPTPYTYTLSLHDALPIWAQGSPCKHWLGVPLCRGERVIGVMAIQSYQSNAGYNAHDLALISHIAIHTVTAIDRVRRDRKSTRLNSSHVKISYAVFCLKKK